MRILLSVIIASISINLSAQAPKWTESNYRKMKYPDKEYLTGFSSYKNQEKQTEEQFIEKLKNYAQSELIQSVQTTIESASILHTREDNSGFNELFKKSSVSTSAMSIAGLKFETYYDKKTKIGYAFAYANMAEVIDYYKSIIAAQHTAVKQKITQAEKLGGEKTKQLSALNKTYADFRKAEEAQSIIYALNLMVAEETIKLQEFAKLKTQVEQLKSNIEKSTTENIGQAASLLAYALKDQLPESLKTVRMQNLSYQDTKMGSSFSRRFSKDLEQKLNVEAGINVVTNINKTEQNINQLLTGTYWEEGNDLRIILVVKDVVENKTLASAEIKMATSWLAQNGINYKPENFQEAYSSMKAFKSNEVTGGGLMAEIWTNKGDENLIYTEGELLKLFVRVNKECHLRVIYHLADGSRVLLIDNYYIGSDKVNKVYELPHEFECAEPFGAETLQLNAQTKAFDPLNTVSQYGYDFISDGLNEILVNTRGFKKVTNTVLKAEQRVIITTMRE